MIVSKLILRGFRCFDYTGTSIDLNALTCLIGPNASGKTSAMLALGRLFGESQAQRQVVPTDFHLAPAEELKSKSERTLSIEARLDLPELKEIAVTVDSVIPEVFNQMTVDGPDETPNCRIRLEARWENDGTAGGNVSQTLHWITTESHDPEDMRNNQRPMSAADRGRFRMIYVPAFRDPEQQTRLTTTTTFGQLLGALRWDGSEVKLKEQLKALRAEVASLPGITTMNTAVQSAWSNLYDGRVAKLVSFQAVEEDPANLARLLVPTFRPGEDGSSITTAALSDGLKSLFSFSLPAGLHMLHTLLRQDAGAAGFSQELADRLPALTIFAVEEPENHLSPHYLGRVVSDLTRLGNSPHTQALLSSHSPSLLGRVSPEAVRYFLGHERTGNTDIKALPLPDAKEKDAHKFVREGIRGHPELYFSRLVILGEGPSEEVLLRRLFEVSGLPLDIEFISVAPLGGRHIDHFWRLLVSLDIPFITLLDLDMGKEGGGWGRIQSVRDKIVKFHGQESPRIKIKEDLYLSDGSFDNLHERAPDDTERLQNWLALLERQHLVFFSSPLDIDLCMLEAFPATYKVDAGPRMPQAGSKAYDTELKRRIDQVLDSDAFNLDKLFTPQQFELIPWYKYLFIDGSKPSVHMSAMTRIPEDELRDHCPAVLARLVNAARTSLMAKSAGG